jgi:cytosine/adenosine deaminase-related metal-dependent hydrolase
MQSFNDPNFEPSLSIDVECTMTADFFTQMRVAMNMQRMVVNQQILEQGNFTPPNQWPTPAPGTPPLLTTRDVLRFATMNGAKALRLDRKTGSLTPGKEADIILVRTDVMGMTPVNNAPGAIVYNAHPGLVDTVLVAGRVVKRNGEMVDVDVKRAMRLGVETRDYVLEQAAGDELINDVVLHGHWTPRQPPAVAHAH